MNCRPKDVCHVVGLHPALGLNGHVVTLRNQPPLSIAGYTLWSFEAPIAFVTPMAVHDIFGIVKPAGSRMLIHELPDEHLRPIRDPGADAVDEMVAKVGPAPMTLTEVVEWAEVGLARATGSAS